MYTYISLLYEIQYTYSMYGSGVAYNGNCSTLAGIQWKTAAEADAALASCPKTMVHTPTSAACRTRTTEQKRKRERERERERERDREREPQNSLSAPGVVCTRFSAPIVCARGIPS